MTRSNSGSGGWFAMLLVGAAGAGFLAFAYFPTAKKIRAARDEVRLMQEFITQTDELRPTIVQLEREFTEVDQFVRQWQSRIPSPEHLANLFGQITERARDSGTTTIHFEPRPEVHFAMLRRVPVSMQVTGSFPKICQLLAALEAMPQPFWVDEVTIERDQTGQFVQGGLNLEVFASNPAKSD